MIMRYAISYVSTIDLNLGHDQLKILLEESTHYNNTEDITGLLLCSEGNFFQLIEGDEAKVKDLYQRIANDTRHNDIIKYLEQPVHLPAYDGYISRFVTEEGLYNDSRLIQYLHYIEVLDPKARAAVKRVLEAMIPQG